MYGLWNTVVIIGHEEHMATFNSVDASKVLPIKQFITQNLSKVKYKISAWVSFLKINKNLLRICNLLLCHSHYVLATVIDDLIMIDRFQ